MATVSSSLQFVGEQPDIIGQVCSGFVVQHFCEETTLVDQANVTFLRFSGIWYRICFETGTVFWRSGQTPAPAVNSTLQHGLLLNDLSDHHSIQGRTLSGIDYRGNDAGDVEVTFRFEGKVAITLLYSSAADSTRIDA